MTSQYLWEQRRKYQWYIDFNRFPRLLLCDDQNFKFPMQMMSDSMYIHALLFTAKIINSRISSPVYTYVFTHEDIYGVFKLHLNSTDGGMTEARLIFIRNQHQIDVSFFVQEFSTMTICIIYFMGKRRIIILLQDLFETQFRGKWAKCWQILLEKGTLSTK